MNDEPSEQERLHEIEEAERAAYEEAQEVVVSSPARGERETPLARMLRRVAKGTKLSSLDVPALEMPLMKWMR